MKNYFKSLSAEQPDVRFFGLRLVKFVSVIFGSVFFFTLAVTLLDTSALDWKLNVEGLKFFFLDAMKVPGSILAFYLAVLGLIGANHRSEQTKKQISATGEQNRFSNYFKHLEEFKKHVDGLEHRDQIDMTNIRMVHDTLFSKAYEFGDYKIDSEELGIAYDFLRGADEYMKGIEVEEDFIKLPEELSYLYSSQTMFGLKNVIRDGPATLLPLDHEQSIEHNRNLVRDLVEFAEILRSIIAFSNNVAWDSRLGGVANSIRLRHEVAQRKFIQRSSLEARREAFAEEFSNMDIK